LSGESPVTPDIEESFMRQRNVSADAARLARGASSDLANLRNAMQAASDKPAGLMRAIKAPAIKTRRTKIKGSTQTSFYRSAAQDASRLYNLIENAQRIF
jgi:hypothetical protein